VKRCVETLAATGADNVGGPARTRAVGYMQKAVATAYHSAFACGGASFHNLSFEGPVDTVTYGCWSREVFQKFGYFDEGLVRNQDDEHNLRISRAGGRIWQNPRIVSWYRPRQTLGALFRQYFQYGYWKVAVIRKHRIPASLRHVVPALFVLALGGTMTVFASAAALGAPMLATLASFLFSLTAALYGLATIGAALACEKPFGRRVIPMLPLVFAVYHVSYGTGFLLALLHSVLPDSAKNSSRIVTSLTR
jgi:succinoglycan biosynthesis protein ExoA